MWASETNVSRFNAHEKPENLNFMDSFLGAGRGARQLWEITNASLQMSISYCVAFANTELFASYGLQVQFRIGIASTGRLVDIQEDFADVCRTNERRSFGVCYHFKDEDEVRLGLLTKSKKRLNSE